MIGADASQSAGARRVTWLSRSFIALVLLLAFPSTGFVQKYSGLAGVAGYVAFVAAGVYVPWRFGACLAPWLRHRFLAVCVLTLTGLAICFAIAYPIENARGLGKSSDRDDGLNLAVTRMAGGQSPYYPSDKFAGPLSVLPGGIFLSAPFVAFGSSGYQNVFWLAAFVVAAWWRFRDPALAIVMLMVPLALSPAAIYEYISGGDMHSNGIYVAVFFLLALGAWTQPRVPRWARWPACVLLGVGLASRPNFLLLMPLFGAVLWRTVGLRQAVAAAGLVVLVSAAITVPFYLHDPAGFTPLLARGKLAVIDHVMPSASKAMIGMTALLGIVGAWALLRSTAGDVTGAFFRWCTWVTLCPMACAVALSTVVGGHLDFSFMSDRFGLMYVTFALFGWGGQWLNEAQTRRLVAGRDRGA